MLWGVLRAGGLGVNFRRQHPIGCFIVDFYCAALGLVVEVDGGVHRTEDGVARDRLRDEWLQRFGLRVVHVDAERVERALRGVVGELREIVACEERRGSSAWEEGLVGARRASSVALASARTTGGFS